MYRLRTSTKIRQTENKKMLMKAGLIIKKPRESVIPSTKTGKKLSLKIVAAVSYRKSYMCFICRPGSLNNQRISNLKKNCPRY